MGRRVALAGLMGVGKSTIGRLLAARLDARFLDLDALVEAEAGVSIAAIFAREGEGGFRAREARALESVLTRTGPMVLSLGGGTLHQPGAHARIAAAMPVAVLRAPVEVLVARCGRGAGTEARPLAGRLAALAAARSPLLDAVGPGFWTHEAPAPVVADQIARWLGEGGDGC